MDIRIKAYKECDFFLGVHYLLNVGELAQKLDVYVNEQFVKTSKPGDLTSIDDVAPGDKITLFKSGFFKTGIITSFVLSASDLVPFVCKTPAV